MNRIIFSLQTFSTILYWLTAALLTAFLLLGCKAKQIDWASECAVRYPVKETFIHGKDYFHTDTLRGDCVIVNCDPIILKAKCPPTLTITKTINRVDTVVKTNTAEISLYKREKEASDTKYYNEQEKRITAEETAQKSTKQRNVSILVIMGLVAFAFRKQLINIFKLIIGLV